MAKEPYVICGYLAVENDYKTLERVNSWPAALAKAQVMQRLCESGHLHFDDIVVADSNDIIIWSV